MFIDKPCIKMWQAYDVGHAFPLLKREYYKCFSLLINDKVSEIGTGISAVCTVTVGVKEVDSKSVFHLQEMKHVTYTYNGNVINVIIEIYWGDVYYIFTSTDEETHC